MEMGRPRIAVIGGGIIGMSTAVSVLENIPGVEVTVIAEHYTPDTTGDGAAGFWMPYLLGKETPLDTQMYWTKQTFEYLKRMLMSEQSSDVGVSLITGYFIADSKLEDPTWKDVVFGYRPMQTKEKQMLGVEHGFAFTTFTTECSKLLPYLIKRFQSFGGKLQKKRVENFQELAKEYEVVVNCTGTWAKHLTNDSEIHPIRGQVVRVYAPWMKMFIISDDYYIIPNAENVVLGGTHQEHNWNLNPTDTDHENILTNCYKLMPSLKNAKIIKKWVGLRPGRKSVRLEREHIPFGNKKLQVVHNYGHGGSGVTIFWGCAQNAVRLVTDALNDIALQHFKENGIKSNI